jgi:hypothetical protein
VAKLKMVVIPEEIHLKVKVKASENGMSVKDYVLRILLDHLVREQQSGNNDKN